MSFPVRPYISARFTVTYARDMGIWQVCKGKQRCPNCGGEHRVEDCKDNGQEKCCNCGGQHRVTYGVRKRAVKIEQVKAVNVSYAEAVKKVQGQKGRDVTAKANQSSRPEIDQTEKHSSTDRG